MVQQTINRREFIAASAAAGLFTTTGLASTANADSIRLPGVQLYTVRDSMAKNVETTLRAVAGIGYREVEFAGYFDHSATEISSMLERYGLVSPSTHVNGEAVMNDVSPVVDFAAEVGHQFVTIAWIQRENRQSSDDFKRWAEVFNRLGEACKNAGLRAAYHNHDFEFQSLDGERPFDILLRDMDSALVDFEVDFYWVRKAGVGIREVLALAPERMVMSHIKDMNPEGDMVRVGDGVIDFAAILADPVAASIQHSFVEHDHPEDPFRSIAYAHYALRDIL